MYSSDLDKTVTGTEYVTNNFKLIIQVLSLSLLHAIIKENYYCTWRII